MRSLVVATILLVASAAQGQTGGVIVASGSEFACESKSFMTWMKHKRATVHYLPEDFPEKKEVLAFVESEKQRALQDNWCRMIPKGTPLRILAVDVGFFRVQDTTDNEPVWIVVEYTE